MESTNIPTTARAWQIHGNDDYRFDTKEISPLQPNEVLVRIKAAALNRRDWWITKGMYPGLQYPSGLGSDGCGIVEAVGSTSLSEWIGKRVVLSPSWGWGSDEHIQSSDFTIRGMPSAGTLAEYIVADISHIFSTPDSFSDAECAALPLAGLTAYRSTVSKGAAREGMNVLITGIGGGVALLAMQIALAKGAKVACTSGSDDKLAQATALGAAATANYRTDKWHKELIKKAGFFDLVIDGTGGDPMNQLIDCLAPGGKLVMYGATLGRPASLNVHKIFWNQLTLEGSTMGSDEDFTNMLALFFDNNIKPLVNHTFPLNNLPDAFTLMAQSEQMGKIVLLND